MSPSRIESKSASNKVVFQLPKVVTILVQRNDRRASERIASFSYLDM
jgi:hypothetical protein